ncbi:MAG: RdgB/HAM1 family non-canonical purine NTP pyrophosphatase [Bacteroidales bacterium]
MELVFVTNNDDKLKEINNLLGDSFILKSLKDLGFSDEIPEIYPTLEQNASAKASFIYDRFSVNCFADDTGLEVFSLNNQPGVYSGRFAELDRKEKFRNKKDLSEANIAKLLTLMNDISSRKARFRTVIALIIEGKETLFEGTINGEIISERRGEKGFGYDPVFVPEGFGQTFAEMTMGEKNRLSHRAKAFRKLVDHLKSRK